MRQRPPLGPGVPPVQGPDQGQGGTCLVSYIRKNFFYGRSFVSDDNLNTQVLRCLDTVADVRIHGTQRHYGPPLLQGDRHGPESAIGFAESVVGIAGMGKDPEDFRAEVVPRIGIGVVLDEMRECVNSLVYSFSGPRSL